MSATVSLIKQVLEWFNLRLVRLEPKVRAATVFFGVALVLYPLVIQVYGLLWGILWSAWLAAFALYFAFRSGYFARRVILQLPGRTHPYPEKIRSIQGGVRFKTWDDVAYLDADEADDAVPKDDRVIGLEIGGDAIAYPLSAMALREVANEEFGELPVSVTWSPITYAARVYVSVGPDGDPFTLAPTDQMVLNSPLLEAENGSLYLQFTGEAIMGPDAGHQLKRIPCLNTTWGAWSSAWPNSEMLSPAETPETDVFEGYYASTRAGLFTQPVRDKRLPDKDVVMGVADLESSGGGSGDVKVFSAHMMQREPLLNTELGRVPVVVLNERSSASYVAFERVVDGQRLTFEGETKNSFRPNRVVEKKTLEEGGEEVGDDAVPHSEYEPWLVRDEQTGSLWHAVKGECVEGEFAGTRLRMLDGQLAFWFAWSKFHGDVELVL